MKKMMKKLVAGVSACVLLVSTLSGCYSEDKAWAARRGDDTAPIGAYIYYLSNAYQEALTLVEDDTKSVFDQEIEGKDGRWTVSYANAEEPYDGSLSRCGDAEAYARVFVKHDGEAVEVLKY